MQCKRTCSIALSCLYVVGFLISCKVLLYEERGETKEEKRDKEMFLRASRNTQVALYRP